MKSCSKCRLQYNSIDRIPKLLPCGHTFCIICLSSLYEAGILMCPKDKTAFSIPIEEISTNYTILEVTNISKPSSDLICCNGHELRLSQTTDKRDCSICRKDCINYHECALCLYQICEKCVN